MDFSVVSNTRFSNGTDIYRRTFSVKKLRNGKIEVQNEMDGKILFVLDAAQIAVHGKPFKKLEDLQAVVYNFSCICDPALDDDNFKIFDQTFDNTFE